ncbi:putative thioesterase [Owenweeksia hongkongensis DSM 17368]|uniref:Putative thioesterase n=1 Tax=Owenweeksia hongkongensis (strain DSM 17368 / CIP 108786 / JCM 12287 / NRRL B-23963 / UST20020801) TaxID=926562 RepID=G8R243_OWEHD|nr:thioesterase family protein [Owenweeksia hongkongensis]AEV31793.1 putative thioesterase [Owenweeksia hongkongensis DSM 17368]
MKEYSRPISLRWSDMDPNFHVRHSVYYDLGAQHRTQYLIENGLSPMVMVKNNFGPILFREEAVFRKEIHFGDQLTMNIAIVSMRKDYSRWTIRHQIMKGDVLCAEITVDGAWIDTIKRKLTVPPEVAHVAFDNMPKSEDFTWQN